MKAKNPRWKPTSGVPAWMDLRQEIMTNTHGRKIIPPPLVPPRTYCIDQVPFEKDDSVASYLRYRYLVGVVADLLSLFRQKVEKEHNANAWETASVIFKEDAERWTLFQFLRQVSAAERSQAVHCLNSISKQGLEVTWPGKIRSCFWSNDCGLKALVGISETMIKHLTRRRPGSGKTRAGSSKRLARLKKHAQIGLDTNRTKVGHLVCLKTHGREPLDLAAKASTLMTMLMREGLVASDEILCNMLWPGKHPGNWEKGALNSLKTLVGSVNKKLINSWGNPPNKDGWICRKQNDAYFLNASVRWAYVTEKDYKKNASRSVDPSKLDTMVPSDSK
jgi:hypothetical protein